LSFCSVVVLGSQIFSIQKPKEGVKPLSKQDPYLLQPGETVVVITAEKVAIPHAYSATVWPRFNMVKRGVFQSMVKIDPTWHGHLAIAMSNLSPAEVILKYDKAFATLIFYELSEESDVDLWKLKDIQEQNIEVVEEIPQQLKGDINRINEHIFGSEELRDYCCVRDKSIVAWGIKREHVQALKDSLTDQRWQDTVDRLEKKWAEKLHPNGKRMIVMPALGMESLWEIVKGMSDEGYLKEEDIRGITLGSDDDIVDAAMKYGKPFDVFARIQDATIERIEEEIIPRAEAVIESKIQIRVIILVFTLFGFISLMISILVMLWKISGETFLEKFSNWAGLQTVIGTGGCIVGLAILIVTLYLLRNSWKASKEYKIRRKRWTQQIKQLRKKERGAKNENRKLQSKLEHIATNKLKQTEKEMEELRSRVKQIVDSSEET
jgi:dUTPase